jgi:ABC-2 type transport system permease protein
MTALIALIRKDVILFLNDKRALLLTILMPVLLAAFFGYIMGGGNHEATKIEVALVNQDTHVISQKIASGLKAEASLNVKELSLEQAQEQVRKGKLSAAILIPAGFGEAAGAALFGAAKKPDLPLYFDPSQTAVLAMVKGMLTQQVMQSVSAEMFSGNSGSAWLDKSMAQLDQGGIDQAKNKELTSFLSSLKKFQTEEKSLNEKAQAEGKTATTNAGLSMPFNTKDEAMTAKDSISNQVSQYNGYAHSFAGMIVQFILFMAIDVGIGVLLARKLGIWNRLLAAPVGVNRLIIARALSCALIAFSVTCFIFAIAMIVFKVKILGSAIGFLGVAVSFSLMTASFGLLIAAFGKTPEAARGIAVFATLIMVMLGGAWMPSFLFPQWLQNFTVLVPTRWAVDGFDAMTWRGLGIDAALPPIAALLAFTLLFGLLATWRFKAQENSK